MYDPSFLVLSSGIGYRMRSYEPRFLQKYREKTLADHMIENIRELSKKSKIYILTGYKHDKYLNKISCLDKKIKLINDVNYENNSMKQAIQFVLEKIKTKSLCILHSDIWFEQKLCDLDFSESFFGCSQNLKEKEIGISIKNGFVEKFSYDSNIKWAKITYFDKEDFIKFKNFVYSFKNNKLLDFEIYNEMLEKNIKIKPQNINGPFMELDNIREIR